MLLQQANAFPTFSKETINAIEEATKGKLEMLWEAEQSITAAILADTSVNNDIKAQEVIRSMNRYLSTASNYALATSVVPGIGIGGYYPPNPMPGMQPNFYNNMNIVGSINQGECNQSYRYTTVDGEVCVINVNSIDDRINTMLLYVNGLLCPCVTAVGVTADDNDDRGVGIALIGDVDFFNDNERASEFYKAFTDELGMQSDDHLFTYTVRKAEKSSILYIELIEDATQEEKDIFDNFVKASVYTHSTFDKIFPESAGE